MIKWGSYREFEGPYHFGNKRFLLNEKSDLLEKLIFITSATEGGTFNAVNMYDSCILTLGMIQYCEKVGLVTRMLGGCASINFEKTNNFLKKLPIPLTINDIGNKWVLKDDDGKLINTPNEMRRVYFNNSSGLKDGWSQSQKDFSIEVCKVFSEILSDDDMITGQLNFTKTRLLSFISPKSRVIIFNNMSDNGWEGALKALFTSYSMNLPAVADRMLQKTMSENKWDKMSDKEKFMELSYNMIFNSNVDIWPHRYEKIKPHLEKIFSIEVPDIGDISSSFKNNKLSTIEGIQNFLIKKGYDLGPAGADGVMGNKTKEAIKAFQILNRLVPDGIVGPKTKEIMMKG